MIAHFDQVVSTVFMTPYAAKHIRLAGAAIFAVAANPLTLRTGVKLLTGSRGTTITDYDEERAVGRWVGR